MVADLGPGRLVAIGREGRAGDDEARADDATAAHRTTVDPATPVLIVPPQGTSPEVLLDGADSVAGALVAADESAAAGRATAESTPADRTPGDRAPGTAPVFGIAWTRPASRAAGVSEILAVLARAIDHLGGSVRLVGCSQGGWLSAIAAALRPGAVVELTLVGAPITFHTGGPGASSARALAAARRLPPVDLLVGASLPCWIDWQYAALSGDVWWTVDPVGESARLLRALGRVGDDDAVARSVSDLGMFSSAESMSRRMYSWFVEHLVLGDEFARGTLEIDGRRVCPGDIRCPVRLVAGKRDTLVPPKQVFAAARYLTGAAQVACTEIDAGHLELVTTAAGDWAARRPAAG